MQGGAPQLEQPEPAAGHWEVSLQLMGFHLMRMQDLLNSESEASLCSTGLFYSTTARASRIDGAPAAKTNEQLRREP